MIILIIILLLSHELKKPPLCSVEALEHHLLHCSRSGYSVHWTVQVNVGVTQPNICEDDYSMHSNNGLELKTLVHSNSMKLEKLRYSPISHLDFFIFTGCNLIKKKYPQKNRACGRKQLFRA